MEVIINRDCSEGWWILEVINTGSQTREPTDFVKLGPFYKLNQKSLWSINSKKVFQNLKPLFPCIFGMV